MKDEKKDASQMQLEKRAAQVKVELIPEEPPAVQTLVRLAEETGGLMMGAETVGTQLRVARGLQMMRDALTEEFMHEWVLPLVGTELGFRTDRDNEEQPYPISVIRDCVLACLLRGGRLVGNEVNIIAGKPHFTLQFFERKVAELPGMANLVVTVSDVDVKKHSGHHVVHVRMDFAYQGEEMFLEGEYPIRCNQGQMLSSSISKGKRAALRTLYSIFVGGKFTPPEGDIEDGQGPVQVGGARVGRGAGATNDSPWPEDLREQIKGKMAEAGLEEAFLAEVGRIMGKPATWETVTVSAYFEVRDWLKEQLANAKKG